MNPLCKSLKDDNTISMNYDITSTFPKYQPFKDQTFFTINQSLSA